MTLLTSLKLIINTHVAEEAFYCSVGEHTPLKVTEYENGVWSVFRVRVSNSRCLCTLRSYKTQR